ncbi:MAG TPA: cation diffusion facilitator family transporter [Acidimicrobiales bacterium]
MASGEGTKAILAAFFANVGIAIAKFVGFLITRSSSMLAESVHSVADSGNQLLLLLGGRRARRPPTPEHPFGYGRERYFWAFVVALVLFSLGSLFAIYEGIEKIRHPHELESAAVALGILGVAIVLAGFSLRTAIVETNHARGEHSLRSFIRHAKAPELPVVLLEDTGAMIGLVIAFVAVIVAEITGEPRWDGAGTISIGVLLGVIAIVLAIEMKSLLIGEGASAKHLRAIEEAILSSPNAKRLIHLRTQHIGPDELLVGAKVHFREDLSAEALADAINDVELRVREAVPIVRPLYIEPDIYRGA